MRDPRVTGGLARRLLILPVAALALATAACGGGGPKAPAAAATSAAAPTKADLSGVTLHVGDQLNQIQSVLKAAGQLGSLPYKISWSSFLGGPTVIAAETGGSVDLGIMAETPVVFAQGNGSPVTVVAAERVTDPTKSTLALLVKKDSPIRTLADLKGKKILGAQGTVVQYLVAQAVTKAGLTPKDVQTVNIAAAGAQAAFDRGDVDVEGTGGEALVATLAQGNTRVLANGAGLLPNVQYLVARDGALADPKTSAAIEDFVGRLAKATEWYDSHPDAAAQIAASTYKIDGTLARQVVDLAPYHFVPIDPAVIGAQQKEADYFAGQGLLKKKVDASKVFDTRYNAIVTAAVKGAS